MSNQIKIENLIELVAKGGKIKTGVDVYDKQGVMLLDKDVVVDKVRTLEILMEKGVSLLPTSGKKGCVWDAQGNEINIEPDGTMANGETGRKPALAPGPESSIERRLQEIEALKIIAAQKYDQAKESIKQVLGQIQETGGEFDYNEVQTRVSDLVEFLTVTDNPFSYLTKEIFSYDDYLYNHSVNVCAIGTAVLNRFNKSFSAAVNEFLNMGESEKYDPFAKKKREENNSYRCYHREELEEISTGLFLHDMGKIMLPGSVLNKSGKLTSEEFELVKRHSYDFGAELLEKNKLRNSFIRSIVINHHAPIFLTEERCYPEGVHPRDIPIHVKIAKLADIYDAMTSKRCYKEAFNQINVVTEIFRKYARKDPILQYVLHAFVKSIGIYPPGSIVYLRNGQLAYVLESDGPLVIAFTDSQGNTLGTKPEPMDMGDAGISEKLKVDNRKNVKTPLEVYDRLPPYLQPKIT